MKLKDHFINLIKGIFIGISNIIPVISSSTLAISLGIYETIIKSLSEILKNKKKNFYILLPIALGIIIGILSSTHLIDFCLNKYYIQTIMFFTGLILGGIKLFKNKIKGKNTKKNIAIFLTVFILMVIYNIFTPINELTNIEGLTLLNLIKLFAVGFISIGAMLIPGISTSLILINLGYYESIVKIINDALSFTSINPYIMLLTFVAGAILGLIIVSKLIRKIFKEKETETCFAILGFTLSSVVALLLQIRIESPSILSIISYIIFLSWGFLLSINFEKE